MPAGGATSIWRSSGRERSGGPIVAGTIWPEIEDRLLSLVREHRSTIIFANNRRTVEKLTSRLNALADPSARPMASRRRRRLERNRRPPATSHRNHERCGRFAPITAASVWPSGGRPKRRSRRVEVPAVVATASLELGIDMGAVDLVCQVESPGSVARGLQRVGRAGHVVRGVSKGRLIAKTPADLLESAALCRAMLAGERSSRCACRRTAWTCWRSKSSPAWRWSRGTCRHSIDLVRSAYPFQNLSAESFESVLRLISGRFPTPELRDLRARVVWDRIHNRLAAAAGHGPACPGRRRHDTRHRAVSGLPGGGGAAAG